MPQAGIEAGQAGAPGRAAGKAWSAGPARGGAGRACTLALALFSSLGAGGAWAQAGDGAATAPQSASIPLVARPDRSGFTNFVRVTAGGGSGGTVLLDTGSTGLRIRQEALGPEVTLTDIPLTYSYTSGNVLTGVLGYALVAFPGASPAVATAEPIAIHVVQSITCKPEVPNCPKWKPTEAGVMGVAYSAVPVFNPLAQLPGALATGFIVVANDRADRALAPRIEVGLTPANTAGFAFASFAPEDGRQPQGLKAWNTKSIPTCFSVDDDPPGCGVTVFDTGAGSGSFETPGLDPALLHTGIPRGHTVTTSVAGAMALSVTSGRKAWLNRYRYEPPHGSVKGFNSGGLVFRYYKVLFDGVNGRIGFSPAGPVTATRK
ncbi:hypothetical protein [Azorhizobium doebereinerae]|uniref:hypothetical protein n=1 Tax=Azorhizobium doebereinerae TaxID=281091 RepID=UPI0012EBD1FA|nr:hypothetical protein [Azorhizobium doebereinerae]